MAHNRKFYWKTETLCNKWGIDSNDLWAIAARRYAFGLTESFEKAVYGALQERIAGLRICEREFNEPDILEERMKRLQRHDAAVARRRNGSRRLPLRYTRLELAKGLLKGTI